MASLKTKFSVGLFLIIGMAVLIIGIVWLGMSNYLEKGRLFVAYFDESVQGLDKDSPVKYRGVSIGRVQSIGVAPDGKLIEAVMKIESETLPEMYEENVVAQLKSVGITGLMFIELEHKRPKAPDRSPDITFSPPHTVIPTKPSEISKFFKGVEDVFKMFRAVDTENISQQLIAALQKVNKNLDDARIDALTTEMRSTVQTLNNLLNQPIVQKLPTSMDHAIAGIDRAAVNADEGISEIRTMVSGVDQIINQGQTDLESITADLKASSQQIKRTMETAAGMLENTDRQMDALQRQVLVTVTRIDQAAQALNRVLEQLANQPSRVIFGGSVPDKPAAP